LEETELKDWSDGEIFRAVRNGIDRAGRALNSQMPWRNIGRMDDEELAAVYAYLTSLPDTAAQATR